jgi:RHS repeat-associated protein
VQNYYAYSPYGETTPTTIDDGNSSEYTGRENDMTGVYYYRARYFDPVLKRFISADPIGLAGGLNFYGYVGENPISYTDPFGLDVKITIKRDTYTDDSVTSTIIVTSDNKGGGFSGNTLETATAGLKGDKSPIAPGTYNARVRNSHVGKRIELEDVDNFKNVQIHVGNTSDDVEGCFAVGQSRKTNEVKNSAAAMKKILKIIKKDGTGNISVQVIGPSVK